MDNLAIEKILKEIKKVLILFKEGKFDEAEKILDAIFPEIERLDEEQKIDKRYFIFVLKAKDFIGGIPPGVTLSELDDDYRELCYLRNISKNTTTD